MESPLDTPSCSSAILSPNPNHQMFLGDPWTSAAFNMTVPAYAAATPTTTIASSEEEGSGSFGWPTPSAHYGGPAGQEFRFQCHWADCGKAFRRPSDLTKHERYHVKDFCCEMDGCNKAFATQKDLKRHARTHDKLDGSTGGKAGGAARGYRCGVPGCRKAKTGHVYNRRDNFARHMRTKHEGMEFDLEDFESG